MDISSHDDDAGGRTPQPILTMSLLLDDPLASLNDTDTGRNISLPEAPPFSRTLPEMIIIGLILSLVILLTIGGNLLVCITIATNKRLQSCTNYFVLSLAVTDLLLGSTVLPFSAVNTLTPHWPLGAVFCNIYNSSDVMLCTVSILTLFAISLDRYFAVTSPLRYQQRMTGRVVWQIMAGICVFSFVMAFLPIHLGWNSPGGVIQNHAHPTVCLFDLNKPYVLLVSLGTYFAPLMIMCGVYMRVLQITRHQVREINKLTSSGASAAMLTRASRDDIHQTNDGQNGPHIIVHKAENGRETIKNGVSHYSNRERRHREHKIVSDTKATVTLASVVLAFAICWVPYFVLFTAKPFLSGEVNIHLDLFALWLGYVNSSINPFLYAFYNSSFREGFVKILCQKCPSYQQKRKEMQTLAVRVHRAHRHGSSSETSEMSVFRQTS